MSNWVEHLEKLASLEPDVKKKVAFQSSAKLIKELARGGADLRAEQAALKQSIPKIRADAIRSYGDHTSWYFQNATLDAPMTPEEFAKKIEAES